MKLTTRSRYGTLIVLDIAQYGQSGPVRISDIARRRNISVKYMEKIISELRKAGILLSRRGPGGGHMLSRPADKIAVGEVVRLLDWKESEEQCLGDVHNCRRASDCLTRRLWQEAEQALIDNLCGITFADLVRDRRLCPAARRAQAQEG